MARSSSLLLLRASSVLVSLVTLACYADERFSRMDGDDAALSGGSVDVTTARPSSPRTGSSSDPSTTSPSASSSLAPTPATTGPSPTDAAASSPSSADSSAPPAAASVPNGTTKRCGDGVIDEGEECDGDNNCSVECLVVACGNGRIDEGEDCEPPGTSWCSSSCRSIACGNDRVDEGEECEPPGLALCSEACLRIECGNRRLDEGEECDPPAAGSCGSDCRTIECGNGRIDEGEGCDPPRQGVCDASCRPVGCGNGRVDEGEECDPPQGGSCDGQCRRIACGNGRVDEGEECEPPSLGQCSDQCRMIQCGNNRVDPGEQCDPPRWGSCNDQCQNIVCGDGRLDPSEQCEPELAGNQHCSNACTPIDASSGTEYLYTFDAGAQQWQLYATSPERLASGTGVKFDSQNGDVSPGTLKIEAPFDAANQKVEVQVTLPAPRDLRGRTIRARVRLASGLSSDTVAPGGIKLFAKGGDDFGYASGAWTYLHSGSGWVEVTLNVDAPILVPNEFTPSQVRQIGVELRTFTESTNVSRAVLYLDSVSI